MMDQWTARLSDYLDDELTSSDRRALEAHLKTCSDCSRTLEELRRVVVRAGGLEDRPPATDLWSGIAQRIGVTVRDGKDGKDGNDRRDELAERRQRSFRRFTFSMPQLAAAAVVLVMASGAGVWSLMQASRQPAEVTVQPAIPQPTANLVSWVDSTQRSFDASVAQLREALESGRGRLDTATVRILEDNLRIIDAAIAQARTALAADPGSAYLSQHLAKTMRTKLELLQRAQAIALRS